MNQPRITGFLYRDHTPHTRTSQVLLMRNAKEIMFLAVLKEKSRPQLVKNGEREQLSHVAYTLEGCEIQIKNGI